MNEPYNLLVDIGNTFVESDRELARDAGKGRGRMNLGRALAIISTRMPFRRVFQKVFKI